MVPVLEIMIYRFLATLPYKAEIFPKFSEAFRMMRKPSCIFQETFRIIRKPSLSLWQTFRIMRKPSCSLQEPFRLIRKPSCNLQQPFRIMRMLYKTSEGVEYRTIFISSDAVIKLKYCAFHSGGMFCGW